jgi:argininosuccinate lyase
VGLLVAHADKVGKRLDQLSLAEMQSIHCGFAQDALDLFALGPAMERRNVIGAPGPKQIRRQLARWRKRLSAA